MHSRPDIDPHEANSRELTPTICAFGNDTHSNTFICRVITTMEQSIKIRLDLNKGTGLVSVSLGSTP